MRSTLGFCVLMFCLTLPAVAEDPIPPAPKSRAALAAIAKHEKAVADAQKVFDTAKAKANQDLIAELKRAQTTVERAGGAGAVEEAHTIAALIAQSTPGSLSRMVRLVFMVKGTADLLVDNKPVAKAHKTDLVDVYVSVSPSSTITIRTESETLNRSFRVALVDENGNVLRAFTAADAGLQSKMPDEAVLKAWPQSQLKGDTGEWIYIPEANKPIEVKLKM